MLSLPVTLAIIVVAFVIAALANWQMRRPFHQRWLPVVPWLGVQFVGAAILFVMLAHLMTLLTGHPWGHSYAP